VSDEVSKVVVVLGAVTALAVLAVEKDGATAAGGEISVGDGGGVDDDAVDAVGGVIAATAGESVGKVKPPLDLAAGGVV
jgi:hypothetical protein